MAELPDIKSAAMALRALKGSDYETEALSGWRRVAVLLASFGEDLAADLAAPDG